MVRPRLLPVVETFYPFPCREGAHAARSAFSFRLAVSRVGCPWWTQAHPGRQASPHCQSPRNYSERAGRAVEAGAGFVSDYRWEKPLANHNLMASARPWPVSAKAGHSLQLQPCAPPSKQAAWIPFTGSFAWESALSPTAPSPTHGRYAGPVCLRIQRWWCMSPPHRGFARSDGPPCGASGPEQSSEPAPEPYGAALPTRLGQDAKGPARRSTSCVNTTVFAPQACRPLVLGALSGQAAGIQRLYGFTIYGANITVRPLLKFQRDGLPAAGRIFTGWPPALWESTFGLMEGREDVICLDNYLPAARPTSPPGSANLNIS